MFSATRPKVVINGKAVATGLNLAGPTHCEQRRAAGDKGAHGQEVCRVCRLLCVWAASARVNGEYRQTRHMRHTLSFALPMPANSISLV